MPRFILSSAALLAFTLLCGCGQAPEVKEGEHAEAPAAGDYERGPHRGRMLRDGDFALELTIFEDGVDPEFRVYPYRGDKPVPPQDIQLSIVLGRLGGKTDSFSFRAQEDFLRGDGPVVEPHSFDVRVRAVEGGRTHNWAYPSYEGRTTLSAQAARTGGVKSERAGPVTIDEQITIGGRVDLTPEGKADVRARLPGRIVSLSGVLGQTVRRGQIIARVESSHSLQTYSAPAPISGVIVEKNTNIGEVTGDRALFVIADPTKLHGEFFIFPRDAERVRVGQRVDLRSLSGEARLSSTVEAVLPTADAASQTLMAHVHLPPSAAANFRPGMGIEGAFTVASRQVPLAVRTKAIQRFRDFEVVFIKVGDTYEVRMLTIGRRSPEWTEILGGLEPGAEYVTDGAFLIRADIEKAGASHDH